MSRLLLLFLLLSATSARAQLTWSLAGGNESWPADKRAAIIAAMTEAVAIYNANGYFQKTLWANYSAGVPTAQASYSGWIDFGGMIGTRVAMHEISHTLGVGQVTAWNTNRSGNTWTGTFAINRVKLFDGPSATLNADTMHFWPYGLNQDSEDGTTNRVRHIKMVSAMRRDMGIVTDSDNDGIPNDWEMFYFGGLSQTATGDADGDGVNNLAEYNADTNPAAFTTQWTGASSSVWTTAGNWTPAIGPSNGTYFTRLNVNNAANNPLIYDADRGTTILRPADRGLVIGSGISGAMSLTGGSLSTAGAQAPDVIGNGVGISGSLTIDGGAFTSDALQIGVSGQGTGTLTLNSGNATITDLSFAFASGGTGTVVLNGGVLTTSGISRTGTGTGTIRFDGGTLRAGAGSATFLEGLSSAVVRANGLTVDTAGRTIAINQALLNDSSSTGGGLTKSGSGMLTLGVANTFTGPIAINAGTVESTHANALGTTASGVTVAATASLALSNNIATPLAESIAIAGAGEGSRGALQSRSGSNTWSGPVSVTATKTRIGVQDGASLAITGNITESAPGTEVIFRAGLTAGNDILLSGGGNAWTGSSTLFSSSATGGAVKLGATNALPVGSLMLIAGPGVSGRFDLNGFDQTVPGLTHSTAGSSALGAGILTNTGAAMSAITLNVPQSVTYTFLGAIQQGSGGVQLVKQGNGTQILSGANTHAGGTTVEAGTLRQGVANAFGSVSAPLTMTGGTANLNGFALGVGALHGTGGFIANNATGTAAVFTIGNGNATGGEHTGTIADRTSGTGTLSLIKTGTGTQSLGGNNTFSGPVTVEGGVLELASASALGQTGGATSVGSGAALRLGDGVTLPAESVMLSGSGGGATVGNFNGALQAAANATATWAGPVVIGDALARIGAMPGGTLTVSGPISGSGAFQSLSVGAGTGGAATVVLSAPAGASTFNGSLAIVRGTLKMGAANTLPATTVLDVDSASAVEDAVFDLNGFSQTVAGLVRTNASGGTGNAIITNSQAGAAPVLTILSGSDATFSGRISGNLGLTKGGTGRLALSNAANAYTGPTTVLGGVLALSAPVLPASAPVEITGTGKLALEFTGTNTVASLKIGETILGPGTYGTGTHPTIFSGAGQLVVPAPPPPSDYTSWIGTFTEIPTDKRGPGHDPDGDGSDNLFEFAFGGDPGAASSNGRPRFDWQISGPGDPVARRLAISLYVRAGAGFSSSPDGLSATIDGLRYRILGSRDLEDYSAPVSEVIPALGMAEPRPGYDWRTFRLEELDALSGKGFLRAGVYLLP